MDDKAEKKVYNALKKGAFMQLQAHAFVVLATLLVGGSFIVSQKLSDIIDPISITLFRF